MNNFIKTYEQFHLEQLKELIRLDRTYVKRKIKEDLTDTSKYSDILNSMKLYDISNFKIVYKGVYLIYPDEYFLKLVEKLNDFIENKINMDLYFVISIDEEYLNLIDFTEGIPIQLKNLGLGYKLYKLMIDKFGYITSNKYSSNDAKNIWYNLMKDPDLYCFTSNMDSGVISKKLDNETIKFVLDKLRNDDIIFDDYLIKKIEEIYGSMDIYKQAH